MYSNEGKEEIQKAAIELLKVNMKSANKVLNIVENYLPELHKDIVKEYDNDNKREFNLSVEELNGHMVIKLPEISSRRSEHTVRLIYEDTLIRMLSDYKIHNNVSMIDDSIIIYEHIVNNSKIKDNDNYNSAEQKIILDCIVSAGIIKTDNGACCSICHISSVRNIKPCTLVHILNASVDNFLKEVTNNVTDSVTKATL